MMKNANGTSIKLLVGVAVLGVAGAGTQLFSQHGRISKIEAQSASIENRLDRIEMKIDKLLEGE